MKVFEVLNNDALLDLDDGVTSPFYSSTAVRVYLASDVDARIEELEKALSLAMCHYHGCQFCGPPPQSVIDECVRAMDKSSRLMER
jgi:hypothetical protein